KFRLMFEGNEDALAAETFVVDGDGQKVRFKSESLEEAVVMKEFLNSRRYEELTKYFGFPGFLLYCHKVGEVIVFVLYREHSQQHQLYERGFIKLHSTDFI